MLLQETANSNDVPCLTPTKTLFDQDKKIKDPVKKIKYPAGSLFGSNRVFVGVKQGTSLELAVSGRSSLSPSL